MKNFVKWFGIIALVAVIGFTFAGCPADDNGGNNNNNGNGNGNGGNSNNNGNNNGNGNGNGGGSGGTLTVTDIPSEYNGKYATYSSSGDYPLLMGFQSLNIDTSDVTKSEFTAVQISNGSVSLPMWVSNSGYTRFSGNRTVGNNNNGVIILNTATFTPLTLSDGSLASKRFQSVTFTNGNASISWNNAGGNGNGGGEGGTFTLSGIPSTHNGKYAFLNASTSTGGVVYGCQSGNAATGVFTLVLISNGSVSLPMWLYNNSNGSLESYSGNHTGSVAVTIFNNGTVDLNNPGSQVGTITFSSVAFSNGGAARSWSQGQFLP